MNNSFSLRKISIIGLLLVTLAGLTGGLATSHWTDETQVTGSMAMGRLEWDITPTALSWNTNTVMEFDVDIDSPGDGPGATGLVAVDLENAYPQGYGTLMLIVRNEGTIPVHVTFWVDTSNANCTAPGNISATLLMDYILLNPGFDAPHYNGIYNYNNYSIADVSAGWTDPLTHSLTWWTSNHGSPSTQISLEDIAASGQILKLNNTPTTIMEHDSDSIIMPGEKSVIIIWIGLSSQLQQHEELMGASCHPAFQIHYTATQALP